MDELNKKHFDEMKKCQRNWDLEKGIPEEHLESLIYAAHNAPKKNLVRFFSLLVVRTREIIDVFAGVTGPIKGGLDNPDIITQPKQSQMYANILFGWIYDKDLKKQYPYGAVALRIDGQYLFGCFTHEKDDIIIQWSGGDTSRFPANAFLMK